MKIYQRFYFLLLLLLSACASTPQSKTQTESPKLNLVLSAKRNLNLEPCGCSLGPIGGLEREYELMKRERARPGMETVALTGGISFDPLPDSPENSIKIKLLKAETLIEGLNLIGTNAVGLAAEDFNLGLENLNSLSARAKFSMVASNLTTADPAEIFWKNSYRYEGKGFSVLVFALSSRPVKPVKGIVWEEPVSKMKSLLSTLPPEKNRFIVVLSTLGETEGERLAQEVPGINLISGSREAISVGLIQVGRATLMQNQVEKGQRVARVEIHFHDQLQGLYNPLSSALYADYVVKTLPELHRLERSLALTPHSKRQALKEKLERMTTLVTRAQKVPLKGGRKLADYEGEALTLGKDYEPPVKNPNPVTSLIEAYKKKNHDLSLLEDQDKDEK
jgi:2',3'-cyclic-nucleotide 2'-phosphodiesterase (5'-nucleotidase family)